MFLDLFYGLRQEGVPVSLQEWQAFLTAREKGLHGSSLARFYHLARACLVKSETYFDAFDRVFLKVFQGVEGEFGEDVTGPEEMEEVAHRILHALSVPVELDGRKALTGMSIGMVLSPGIPGAGMSNVQKLVQDVDAAMFAAKDAGRNRFAWFSPEMLEKDHARPNFLEAMAKRILNR